MAGSELRDDPQNKRTASQTIWSRQPFMTVSGRTIKAQTVPPKVRERLGLQLLPSREVCHL